MGHPNSDDWARMHPLLVLPARGLIGLRSEILTMTRGYGIMNHLFHDYGPWRGEISGRTRGSLIASEGQTRVWTKVLTLEPGTYQYRYVVDGEWREDPTNPQSAPGPTGQPNSILHVR